MMPLVTFWEVDKHAQAQHCSLLKELPPRLGTSRPTVLTREVAAIWCFPSIRMSLPGNLHTLFHLLIDAQVEVSLNVIYSIQCSNLLYKCGGHPDALTALGSPSGNTSHPWGWEFCLHIAVSC